MNDISVEKAVRDAADSLLLKRKSDEGIVISLPSLYPSGSPVQVRVSFDGNCYFVNDMGNAFHEAELIGATPRVFNRHARDVADDLGILFDNHSIFTVNVSENRLSGAIQIVGSASQKAVLLTESQMTEQRDSNVREEFVENLYKAFGINNIDVDVTYQGSSSHAWKFAARHIGPKGATLFDASTSSPNSIFSTHAKFADLKRLDSPPRGVIGIPSFEAMSVDYRNLLQQVANVVEIDSSDTILRKFG